MKENPLYRQDFDKLIRLARSGAMRGDTVGHTDKKIDDNLEFINKVEEEAQDILEEKKKDS